MQRLRLKQLGPWWRPRAPHHNTVAALTIIYWRDIPAQVIAEEGRGRQRRQAKIEMPSRFSVAIDAAAMRDGAAETDDYLAEWRRSDPIPCDDDLGVEAEKKAAEIETAFPQKRLAAIVAAGGFDSS